jgi:hypothetical protein
LRPSLPPYLRGRALDKQHSSTTYFTSHPRHLSEALTDPIVRLAIEPSLVDWPPGLTSF